MSTMDGQSSHPSGATSTSQPRGPVEEPGRPSAGPRGDSFDVEGEAKRLAPELAEGAEQVIYEALENDSPAFALTKEQFDNLTISVEETLVTFGKKVERQMARQYKEHFDYRYQLLENEVSELPNLERAYGDAIKDARFWREQCEIAVAMLPNYGASDDDLKAALLPGKGSERKACGSNIEKVLTFSSELKGRIRFNEITRDIEITAGYFSNPDLQGHLDVAITNWLETKWDMFADKGKVGDQLALVARRDGSYDPVAEYLNGLTWDGVERIDNWLTDYCHVQPSDYTRKIGMRWLLSGVARGLQPGCKVDTVLILQGPQGFKKSMVFDVLAGEWFSDSPLNLDDKDARITACNTWIIELAELAALTGQSKLEKNKSFLSSRTDKVRPPYARVDVRLLRHSIMGATTNDDDFLIDDTGNRRYWVARVTRRIDDTKLRRDRDQLWAEAVARYRAGLSYPCDDTRPAHLRWWFDEREQIIADKENQKHEPENVMVDKINRWFATRVPVQVEDGVPPTAFKLLEVAERLYNAWNATELKKLEKAVAKDLRKAGFESDNLGTTRTKWWFKSRAA